MVKKALGWLCIVLAPLIYTFDLVDSDSLRSYELCVRVLACPSPIEWIGLVISLGLLVVGILILIQP